MELTPESRETSGDLVGFAQGFLCAVHLQIRKILSSVDSHVSFILLCHGKGSRAGLQGLYLLLLKSLQSQGSDTPWCLILE